MPIMNLQSLINSDNVLSVVGETLSNTGLAGDTTPAELLYLVTATRWFAEPVHAVIRGASGSGKSYLAKRVLALWPTSDVVSWSSLSPRALSYIESDIRNRVLFIEEWAGIDSDDGSVDFRLLLSEGRLARLTVNSNETGQRSSEQRVVEGPCSALVTTTNTTFHPEDESRLLAITVPDSEEMRRAVRREQARLAAGGLPRSFSPPGSWHEYAAWLRDAIRNVRIPYAEDLAESFSPTTDTPSREFERLLTLTKAHAFLHQSSRQVEDGQIIAVRRDFEEVDWRLQACRSLISAPHAQEPIEAVVVAVFELSSERPPTNQEVADRLSMSEATASRKLAAARRNGFLVNRSPSSGLASQWILTERGSELARRHSQRAAVVV